MIGGEIRFQEHFLFLHLLDLMTILIQVCFFEISNFFYERGDLGVDLYTGVSFPPFFQLRNDAMTIFFAPISSCERVGWAFVPCLARF